MFAIERPAATAKIPRRPGFNVVFATKGGDVLKLLAGIAGLILIRYVPYFIKPA
jgi:hypothetical protein